MTLQFDELIFAYFEYGICSANESSASLFSAKIKGTKSRSRSKFLMMGKLFLFYWKSEWSGEEEVVKVHKGALEKTERFFIAGLLHFF